MKNYIGVIGFIILLYSFFGSVQYLYAHSAINYKNKLYKAINKAGYQRMLSQRIAKSYLAVVADIEPEWHQQQIVASAALFEYNFEQLRKWLPYKTVQIQLREVDVLWNQYRDLYRSAYSKSNAILILKHSQKILKACHEVVEQVENLAHQENNLHQESQEKEKADVFAALINEAGKQRMLTQRLLLWTLARHLEVGTVATVENGFANDMGLFLAMNRKMSVFEENTPAIQQQLSLIIQRWQGIQIPLLSVLIDEKSQAEQKKQLEQALRDSEQVLNALDQVVGLYEREAALY